jgi:amino acid adenylation domain-containing protein
VDHVREAALTAYEHQELPFEMLVEDLKPPRHLGHSPLFQVLFALRNNAEGGLDIPGLEIGQLAQEGSAQARFDLQLFLTESTDGLRMSWVFADSLFDADTIGQLADAYRDVLDTVSRNPSLRVCELPVLQRADRERIACWNDTARDYPRDARIEEIFEARARRHPDAVALIHGHRRMSYGELSQASSRVAAALATHGVGRGDLVGLCLARSFDVVVGLLGVLKSGAAYVPMDPDYPAARLAYIVADSMPRVVLSHAQAMASAGDTGVPVWDLANLPAGADRAALMDGTPDETAVVMYTSGSTGQAKGVCLPHRTLVNLMVAMARRHPLMAADMPTLQFATINFDMSLYEITSALFTGSPLVLLDANQRLEMPTLIDVLRDERVGRIYLPTAMLAPFVAAARLSAIALPDLRLVQVAGEALTVTDAVRSWCAQEECVLLNLYGPTESHVVSDWMLDGDPAYWPSVPPIGRPIDNVRLRVMDAQGNELPVGVRGELHIAGDGLALGYLHASERTAERFIMHDGERLYRTGDVCRWRTDGALEYVGRSDFQVKIRGFRVEPGEVEEVLANIHGVAEAIVVAGDAPAGGKELRAYVVGQPSVQLVSEALGAVLASMLPDYMRPAAISVMEAFPLNANGKVDRARLPAPTRTPVRTFEAPQGQVEQAIATAWATLFGLDRVGRHDHFFELGGHSILAIRMLSMLDPAVVGALHVRDLFLAPTVSGLANLAKEPHVASAWRPLSPCPAGSELPVIFAVPGAGATSAAFQPLEQALRGRIAIRAFEHRGMGRDTPLPVELDEVVQENLAALRDAQPHGPYTLAGHSFGGAVAFAMGCVLEAAGESVTLLLLDSVVHHPADVSPIHGRRSLDYFRRRLPILSSAHPDDESFVEAFRVYLVDDGLLASPTDDGVFERYLTVVDQQLEWFATFRPDCFQGDVHLFLATRGNIARLPADAMHEHYGRCMARTPNIVLVPGDHHSMLMPANVAVVAERVTALDAAGMKGRRQQP